MSSGNPVPQAPYLLQKEHVRLAQSVLEGKAQGTGASREVLTRGEPGPRVGNICLGEASHLVFLPDLLQDCLLIDG